MSKYDYELQASFAGGWHRVSHSASLGYYQGMVAAHRETPGPRLAWRILRSDGKVVGESPSRKDVDLGMVAGFPTPQQYYDAADRARAKGDELRDREWGRLQEWRLGKLRREG